MHRFSLPFTFNFPATVELILVLWGNVGFFFSLQSHLKINKNVLLSDVWCQICLMYLVLQSFISLQWTPAQWDSRWKKLYLIGSKWTTCWVKLNRGILYPWDTWRRSSMFFFFTTWITVTHSSLQFLERVTSPLTTPPICCRNASSINDLCCSYLWVSEFIF